MSNASPPPATHDHIALKLAGCDNVGASGDERDVYTILQESLDLLGQTLTAPACRDNCHLCCNTLPLVTSVEWLPIHRFLVASPIDLQTRVIAMAELLRPMAAKLKAFQQLAVTSAGPLKGLPLAQCPFLLEGRCAAYAARPTTCRGFGQMAHIGSKGHPEFFGSDLALAHLKVQHPGGIDLPMVGPYLSRIRELNSQIDGTKAFLPQWIWAHVAADGRIVPEPTINPSFA